MKESHFHNVFTDWVLDSFPNAWIYKTNDLTTRGVPDLCIVANGKTVWIELKHNHKLTPIQYATMIKIVDAGGLAYVARDRNICHINEFKLEDQTMGKKYNIKDATFKELIK